MESLGFKLSTPKQSHTFAEPDLWKRPGKTAKNITEICLPHSSRSAMPGKGHSHGRTVRRSVTAPCSSTHLSRFLPEKSTATEKHLLPTHAPGQSREGQGWSHFSTGGQFTCKNDLQTMITFWVLERHFLQNLWSWPADLGETGSICH